MKIEKNEVNKKKSNKLNILIILVAFIALLVYMSLVDGIRNILNIFAHCNIFWLFSGILIMAFCWFIESYIINVGLQIFNKKLKFKESAKNCILGQFFSNITPSATGGQPFQAYYMNQCGINYGTSTSVLLIKFICFQISLTLVCGIFIFLNFKELTAKIQGFSIIMLTGFAINAIIAGFLIIVSFNKNIAVNIALFVYKTINKIKIIKKFKTFKNINEKFQKAKLEIELFSKNSKIIFKNKKIISYIIFLTIIQILSFYFINVIIAMVFRVHLSPTQIYKVIVGASCIQMSSTFIPLPGAVGGAEVSYYVFFDDVFSPKKLSAALLLWRIYSFYIPIILGLICSKTLKSQTKNKPAKLID